MGLAATADLAEALVWESWFFFFFFLKSYLSFKIFITKEKKKRKVNNQISIEVKKTSLH